MKNNSNYNDSRRLNNRPRPIDNDINNNHSNNNNAFNKIISLYQAIISTRPENQKSMNNNVGFSLKKKLNDNNRHKS